MTTKLRLIVFSILVPTLLTAQFEEERVVSRNLANVRELESVDLNGDGYLDIIASSNGCLVWYENNQQGSFDEEHIIAFKISYIPIYNVLDADGDNDMDVLLLDVRVGALELYKNNGQGDFVEKSVIHDFEENMGIVRHGDLDGDEDVDIVLSVPQEQKMYVLTNTGDFEFNISSFLIEELTFIRSFELADLNGDEALDIVAISNIGSVWLENDGDANFTHELLYETNTHAFSTIVIADLHDDEFKDILFVASSRIYVLTNDGDTNFSVELIGEGFSQFSGLKATYLEDHNGDGHLDIFYASNTSDRIGWIPSDGLGGFLTNISIYDDANEAIGVLKDDFDQDGIKDIAFSYYQGLTIGKGQEDLTFSDFENVLIMEPKYVSQLATMDVDNDGDLDIVAGFRDNTGATEKRLAWYENFDSEFRIQHEISNRSDGVDQMELADFDGDGFLDILTTSHRENGLDLYKNTGSGGFQQPIRITTDVYGPLAVADVNLDGDPDIIYLGANATIIYFRENTGFGTFFLPTSIASGNSPEDLNTGDINGDGYPDVLFTDYGGDRAAWVPNDTEGDFDSSVTIASGVNGARAIEVGDFDGDLDLDVIVAASIDDRLEWFENNGSGGFSFGQSISNRDFPRDPAVADFDNDGDLDILGVFYSDFLSWYKNDGTGFFEEEATISQEDGQIEDAIVADVDANGSQDVIAGFNFFQDQKITWYRSDVTQVQSISAQLGAISCNSNDTSFDETDDILEFEILVNQMSLSSTFVLAVENNEVTPFTGNYGETQTFSLQAGSAGNGDVLVTILDGVNPAFSSELMITDPGVCSTQASISAQSSDVICVDNETAFNPDDDVIEFSLIATQVGESETYTLSSNAGAVEPASGVYGELTIFRFPIGSAGDGDVLLRVSAQEDATLFSELIILDPGNCSTQASISAQSSDVACVDNETPTNPDDDIVQFALLATQVGESEMYALTSDAGLVEPSVGVYGELTTYKLPMGSAGAGDILLRVTAQENTGLFSELTILDPGNCSLVNTLTPYTDKSVTVFPNPSSRDFQFKLTNQNGGYTLQVHNTLGQLMAEKQFSRDGSCTFQTDSHVGGAYFYKVLDVDFVVVQSGRLLLLK